MSISILLVDDDDPFRQVACRALRSAGHAVESACDGDQAVRFLEAEAPDILITDIIMPNVDGIELIRTARHRFPAVRILAISGRGRLRSLDLLGLASQLGAHATLAKPLSTEDLLGKVAELSSAA